MPRPDRRRPAPAHRTARRTPHVAIDVDADRVHRPADRAGSRSPAVSDRTSSPSSAGSARSRCATGARSSASGRRSPDADRAARRRRRARARARPASASTRRPSTPAPGDDYELRARRRARCPTRARAGSREGLRGPSRRLRPARVRRGPTATSAPPACTTRSSTSCTSARSRPRAPSRARSRTCSALAELGVTTIELMPVAEFPGDARLELRRRLPERRPVLLRRPARRSSGWSTPPTRSAWRSCSTSSTTTSAPPGPRRCWPSARTSPHKHETPWGAGLNVDDEHCDAVREWVCQSAEGWVRDFHLDGLRLDAIHAIVDSSPEHLVAEIARRVHAARPRRARDRRVRPQRPAGHARARARRPRLRRRLGGRLPPRAANAC